MARALLRHFNGIKLTSSEWVEKAHTETSNWSVRSPAHLVRQFNFVPKDHPRPNIDDDDRTSSPKSNSTRIEASRTADPRPTMSTKYAFTKTLKEVRFLFCQTGEHSAATRYVRHLCISCSRSGAPSGWPRACRITQEANWLTGNSHGDRSFLTRAYPTMKKFNPTVPIMLREAAGTLPKVYARYEFGHEKSQSLEGIPASIHTSHAGTRSLGPYTNGATRTVG